MVQPVVSLWTQLPMRPVLQTVGTIAAIAVLFRSPLTEFIGEEIKDLYNAGKPLVGMGIGQTLMAARRIIRALPEISIAAAAGAAYHHLNKPSLTSVPEMAGYLKVAQFIGGTFLLKSILSALLDKAVKKTLSDETGNPGTPKETHQIRLTSTAVQYLSPLFIATLIAYHFKHDVKLIQTAVFTGNVLILMKLLGAAYSSLIKTETATKVFDAFYGPEKEENSYERISD